MTLLEQFLENPYSLDKQDLTILIDTIDDSDLEILIQNADKKRKDIFENKVFMIAIVEISSYCKQNCFYCGLRSSNKQAERYRMLIDTILNCCQTAYDIGYRNFIFQGGEDIGQSLDEICSIVRTINSKYMDCSITLSIGEKSKEEYQAYFDAGARGYLLRHEAASRHLYERIHPSTMSYDNRMRCLEDLRNIGFQVAAGFMVGLPTQTAEDLAEDLIFTREFKPHIVGIGPFLAHKDTPFSHEKNGTLRQTLLMIALTRLILPKALIPSTTALGTLDPIGREQGFKAGCNVAIPNISPADYRKKYVLYDNKIGTSDTNSDSHELMNECISKCGMTPCYCSIIKV